MRRPRRGLTLAAVVAACLAAFVPSAAAIDPFPTIGVATLASDHFMVHYSRNDEDTTCTNFITQENAGDLLGMLERAYFAARQLGICGAAARFGQRRLADHVSTSLGNATLRGGNNDVRFVLPQQLFNRLRTKAASNMLQSTSMSPSGDKGATYTRRVLVQVAKPKPKKRR